jgi:SAM-dependent methyltransferase
VTDWDAEAATFDDEPDHGLRDPAVRAAWAERLAAWLPEPGAVLDAGCGTGSLSALLAEQGHRVVGVDRSMEMARLAQAKGVAVQQADAAASGLAPGSFDAVVVRHLLWALPDPRAALADWRGLLRPRGRLVLVEGRWSTGAGLTAAAVLDLVPGGRLERLDDPALWGGPVADERYAVIAT